MKTKFAPQVLILLCLILSLSACDGLAGKATPTAEPEAVLPGKPPIAATGIVVPATFSTLSTKASGIIESVAVQENNQVRAGQVLIRLQGSESLQAAIAAARLEVASAEYALEQLYKDPDVRVAAANQAVARARQALKDAERYRRNLNLPAAQVDIDQARANVAILKDKMEDAQEDYEPYAKKPEDNPVRAAYLSRKAQAEKDYENAVRRLNNMLEGANELDVVEAQADLEMAQAEVATTERDYEMYKIGPDPDEVRLAEERLANAKAQLSAAEAALKDLELVAPFDGTISEVYIHTGEWVNPGQPVLLLADLANLQVETTDLNEIDVARVVSGYPVRITFDALPDVSVQGKITRIATKAAQGSGVNYTVLIDLAEIPEALRWGMTAFVDIEVE